MRHFLHRAQSEQQRVGDLFNMHAACIPICRFYQSLTVTLFFCSEQHSTNLSSNRIVSRILINDFQISLQELCQQSMNLFWLVDLYQTILIQNVGISLER